MDTMLTRSGRFLGLAGLASLAFGIIVLVWPRLSLVALVALFGAFSLIYGAFMLGTGLNLLAHKRTEWVPYVLGGAAGVAIGAVTFFRPGITTFALLYLIAGFAVITGIFAMVAAIDLHGQVEGAFWLGLSGLASVVFGAVIAIWPTAGVLAVLWLIGIYAIVAGVTQLVASYRIHGLQTRLQQTVSGYQARRSSPT